MLWNTFSQIEDLICYCTISSYLNNHGIDSVGHSDKSLSPENNVLLRITEIFEIIQKRFVGGSCTLKLLIKT